MLYVINKETSEEKEEKICSSCDKVIQRSIRESFRWNISLGLF